MKMFMASLEGKARTWYEWLPTASISSLIDFHTVFFWHFKVSCPLLLLVEDCCECFDSFIQNLEQVYQDDQFMDDELVEALHERPLRHPAIEEEHDRDSCHTTQESISRANDETEEDLSINDPEDGDEASHPSKSMSLEVE